ncbi:uncharacterized protein NECHADRAFT_77109 [Fusarium vanettenii 77-13-4]|uniref:Uncharacterized protein n=1 Tax=Fusarium vanettenii (strain ATCC MYA-4622 / CBS 123669 / FGSC 9596 / NRRL 45880 / 77-13-4) TaxID=660122 RepID=C7ZCN0_FUSV7|nr:uncharacterized protein NECHADRAFT_77109 [Fusarium vanettenii 77-13-4]EEU38396.1 predicted protein [Fusarium vanettenii 77-13-4]
MVRRGSIDTYHCEPCLPQKYFTRSVSRSCANQSSLATQPGDHVPLVEEVSRAQVLTPESEVKDPISSVHEDNGQMVSRLFGLITQFWSLVIQDEALPLSQGQDEARQGPVSPPTTVADDITSREECSDSPNSSPEFDGVDELPSDAAISDDEELEARDCTPGPRDGTNQTTFNLENLLLGEELKRLRVWKTAFSNDDLDRLPFIKHEVAQGVLKCLTGVANTLIKSYSERQALLKSEDLAESLQHLIKQIESKISVASVEDDAMTDCDGFSMTQGSTCTVEEETPLEALRFDIGRLQMLSQSLRLGLSNGIIVTVNG